MLLLLSLSVWLFPQIPVKMWNLSLLCLIAIGFMTYGPHVLIVASAPMDYGTRKAASSVTGFIDGVGYIGAALTGILSGWLTDVWGWNAAFYLWIGASVFAGVLMMLLWNYKPKKREYQ
jgi:OPA family glycerol-3-phosphate transporter-like MFS transporter